MEERRTRKGREGKKEAPSDLQPVDAYRIEPLDDSPDPKNQGKTSSRLMRMPHPSGKLRSTAVMSPHNPPASAEPGGPPVPVDYAGKLFSIEVECQKQH